MRKKKEGKKWKGWMVRGSGISCFIKDIDYNGMSEWKGRKEKEKNEKE